MANSLNTEVAENTERMDEELERGRDSPLLLDHHHMSSPDEFTPEIHNKDNRGEYRFQCPHAGLFRCSITGLVFRMEGEGEVLYRTVPWDWRLLAQNGKRPAGPLFKFTCLKRSVCQLHLPHCEIYNSGGCDFLSVAHVTDDIIEFIPPREITETHIIINISGFSAYGEVKDEDSPTVPIRALVLLFYKPPVVPKKRSILNVLWLPRNAVIREVQEEWKRRNGDKCIYIETNPRCQLTPNKEYELSTDLTDEYLIQPKDAEFVDFESYENYFPTFQLFIQTVVVEVNLLLKENGGEESVWYRHVWLPATPPSDDSAVSPTEVPSSVKPPGGATAGTTNVSYLLLGTLAELVSKELEAFQWHLIQGVEGFTSIPRGQLENANKQVTVDRMVQQYLDDGAVKITLEILRKMDQNKLAEYLEKKFPNNV
ncbi:uncharacterized protein [Salmo salar]|uniref:NACHT, LRR and PYD domains-containing protein 1-like n=1 Tax=Salmo salar TaxID=8030 RepID=A0A1S3QI60_SALSA|nr:uncharacterized protein LOC106592855 [Salmo salar]